MVRKNEQFGLRFSSKMILLALGILIVTWFFIRRYTRGKHIPWTKTPDNDKRMEFIEQNLSKVKPLAYEWPTGILVIYDYDFMKYIFTKKNGAHRVTTPGTLLDEELREKEHNMFRAPTQLLKMHKGTNTGLALGDYDEDHRTLRQKFHQTMTKLSGKDKTDDIVTRNVNMIVERIELESRSNAHFDPGVLIMNGAMNVTSGLLFGDIYSFDDDEFKKVAGLIKVTFNEFKRNQAARAVVYLLPKFIITSKLGRKLIHYFLPTLVRMGTNVYDGFYPFLLGKIKEHQDTIDKQSPRDLLDFLLIETDTNDRIGWHAIIFTCMALYIGGSDTIATTMKWILVCLAQNKSDQVRCRVEILAAKQRGKPINHHTCPYFFATLLESQRRYPSGETVLHRLEEDIQYQGYFIPRGTFMRGIPMGSMLDPVNFPDPMTFNPARFIDANGAYKFDPHVCNFSVGLRQCPGTTISRKVLAELTSELISTFDISLDGDVKIASSDGGMMIPSELKLKWKLITSDHISH